MVKGVSKQVIVVHAPEPKLFEQAIFILKDEAVTQGVTDEMLLREARQAALSHRSVGRKAAEWYRRILWMAVGAALTGCAWLLTMLI